MFKKKNAASLFLGFISFGHEMIKDKCGNKTTVKNIKTHVRHELQRGAGVSASETSENQKYKMKSVTFLSPKFKEKTLIK